MTIVTWPGSKYHVRNQYRRMVCGIVTPNSPDMLIFDVDSFNEVEPIEERCKRCAKWIGSEHDLTTLPSDEDRTA